MSTDLHPKSDVLVSIILVNYNGGAVILDCVRSLLTHLQHPHYEIIVVDNASQDGSVAAIQTHFPTVKILALSENLGFGAGNNRGVAIAQGKFLFFLNPDTLLTHDPLPKLMQVFATQPNCGLVGPMLRDADGSWQVSIADAVSLVGEYRTRRRLQQAQDPAQKAAIAEQFQTRQPVDILLGAALLMRQDLFQELGGFDEQFFMYFEESDLCQRVRDRGYQILYCPDVSVTHLKSVFVQQVPDRMAWEYRRSQLYYYAKHRPIWEQGILRFYLLGKFLVQALRYRRPFDWQLVCLPLRL